MTDKEKLIIAIEALKEIMKRDTHGGIIKCFGKLGEIAHGALCKITNKTINDNKE